MPILPSGIYAISVSSLIKAALRKLGAVASGETPSPEELQDGLDALNSMVESWNIENLMAYRLDTQEFTLIPDQQDYTFGPGGDFDGTRPSSIASAQLRVTTVTPNYDRPLQIVNDDEWASITQKSLDTTYPLYVNNQGEVPLTTVSFWPIPTEANKVVFYTPFQVPRFALADMVYLPLGYERAMTYGLAIEVSPEFRIQVSSEIAEIYRKAVENIKNQNKVEPKMACDAAITGVGYSDDLALSKFRSGIY